MIKINLVGTKKQVKPKAGGATVALEAGSSGQSLLLVAILILGAVVGGGWWWMLSAERSDWVAKHAAADQELKRLEAIRAKGDEYKVQKDLLARKIDLITNLKKQQAVPVHILDQVSRNLPDFVWLDTMGASNNQVTIAGKATTYNAVSNFYSNLNQSGYFQDVTLGRVFEVVEGVSFSLTCRFAAPAAAEPAQS